MIPAIFLVASSLGDMAPAAAQTCSFSASDVNFGSIDPTSNLTYDSAGALSVSCRGTKNRTVRVCPNIGSGTGNNNATASERYLLSGATQLKYNLYQDSGHSNIWGSYVWPYPPTAPVIDLDLGATGNGAANATLYGRIFANQSSSPVGSYSSNFSGNHTLMTYQYLNTLSPQSCVSIGATNGIQAAFLVTATISPTCTIQATNLDFGSVATTTAATDSSTSISLTCTSGTPYTVSLNGGLTGATDPTKRVMSSASTADIVSYGIYRDTNRTLPWGNVAGTNTVAGTATGQTQTLTGYGRVPAQTTPSPFSYSDTVVVTVTY